MNIAERFAGRLRELREKAGLTQTELAAAAGVKRDAITRWERGDREPAWSSVLSLAEALGVSVEAFTEEPAKREPPGPGRPKKVGDMPAVDPGRPARATKASGAAEGSTGEKKRAKSKEKRGDG
jgi:transcriptional regulator with XRE-family HTH domain